MRARPLVLLLLFAIAAIAPSGVVAHAELQETVPAEDSTAVGAPTDVSATASGTDVILPIVAALDAVAIVGLYLLTRRRRTSPPT